MEGSASTPRSPLAALGILLSPTVTITASQSGGDGHASVLVAGSTFTPLTLTIGATTHSNFTPIKINKWGTIVGFYSSHGFKRWSNGRGITLDFPGAKDIYKNGAFKTVKLPNITFLPYLAGISLSRGLIAGWIAGTGFIATCN
jgi:hypothetical protein